MLPHFGSRDVISQYSHATIRPTCGFLYVAHWHQPCISYGFYRAMHFSANYSELAISATDDPIHFMFGSRVGFSGTANRTALFKVRTNPRYGGHRHVGNISSGDISATGRLIHFMFCFRVEFSGTADLMALFPVRTNPRWRSPPFWKKIQMAISPQLVVRSTSC